MVSTPAERQTAGQEQATLEASDLNWQLPSPDAIAESALDAGLRHTVAMTGFTESQVLEMVRNGELMVSARYRDGVAKQVAEAIGMLDDGVKAVYVMDFDATPDDTCFRNPRTDPRIHLIVWAARRTHALSALAAAIDRAIVSRYRDIACAPDLRSLLDVQVVDDADVSQRTGYGATLSSIHRQPLALWARE
jgi:hypothetical protein